MILIDVLRENNIHLSPKGIHAMAKAIKEVFPTADDGVPDEKLVFRVLVWDIKEEDCLKIIQLTTKYAKLWIFS